MTQLSLARPDVVGFYALSLSWKAMVVFSPLTNAGRPPLIFHRAEYLFYMGVIAGDRKYWVLGLGAIVARLSFFGPLEPRRTKQQWNLVFLSQFLEKKKKKKKKKTCKL